MLSDRRSQDHFDIPDAVFETLFEENIGVMPLLVIPRVVS
jgi:hypothetical protein